METEGHLHQEEPASFEAETKSEALYKYLCLLAFRENKEPYHKSLSDHNRSEYNEGGWGYFVKELADSEKTYNDNDWFKGKYAKYNK